MQLEQITPLILTYNEADNIDRTLSHLNWAKQIIVIDSFSSDLTLEILESYPTVKLYQRAFDTHACQWNYGVGQVGTEWVLSLDADYIVPPELYQELVMLEPGEAIGGYFIPFKYCVCGHPLRGTILPPRQALFRRDRGQYIDDGHTQLLHVTGESAHLKSYFYHDDRKPLGRWLWAQDRYMVIEAQKLLNTPAQDLSWGDRLRKQKIIAPFVVLFYCLILRGGILDGWYGWYYAWQRMLAEIVLALRLIEQEKLPRH
ncbi:glycosyltransferase family 2 protein [Candidatus Synechococcus calcipolaris G9]|uniref:Glycosyltransferase family 2 protein n=1 Tax=Candidatus Synechococcus calcipolaris G9 TaxID=1497997 RepID=A0ABT6EXY6_9SYNE|nr:glycosyltransferase family 2 protein [Candidatus Synechococcus calcipolaris]MDG2990413.1 glycosyltransferase family 2 protein [Candidatus Synechococcus calcipolaris G9]